MSSSTKPASRHARTSAESLCTFSPLADMISSILMLCLLSENQPRLSAMRWLLEHPVQVTITTPFLYACFDICFSFLVPQTLHVNASSILPSILVSCCPAAEHPLFPSCSPDPGSLCEHQLLAINKVWDLTFRTKQDCLLATIIITLLTKGKVQLRDIRQIF